MYRVDTRERRIQRDLHAWRCAVRAVEDLPSVRQVLLGVAKRADDLLRLVVFDGSGFFQACVGVRIVWPVSVATRTVEAPVRDDVTAQGVAQGAPSSSWGSTAGRGLRRRR